jgi:8-oxo-dGTP pyrophosphatase MutT (NUDIX family)
MPLCWEVPGGAVDDEDASVLHAAARELFEEAGLVATRFVAAVTGGGDAPEEFHTRSGRRMGKVSFLVDVAGAPGQPEQPGLVAGGVGGGGDGGGGIRVTLDPNEHVAYLWVTEEEARARRAGDVEIIYTRQAQEDAILDAFRVWENLQRRNEPTL